MPEFEDLYERLLPQLNHAVDVMTSPEDAPHADTVVYRLGFRSMQVHGLEWPIRSGRTTLHQIVGPVFTQQTHVQQRAGFPLVFDKHMERGLEVAPGQWICVAQLIGPPPEGIDQAILAWRDEARAAVGVVAAVVDERIAQGELFEDVIFIGEGHPRASGDLRERIRHFLPYQATPVERQTLAELGEGSGQAANVLNAARWYLRGAQSGPTPDGVVFLWVAIEALSPDRTVNLNRLETKLAQAGWEVAHQRLDVGRLQGLRGRIVHYGDAAAEEVSLGFYDLEAMVRVLLRDAVDARSTWPAPVGANLFTGAWGPRIAEAWHSPTVNWTSGAVSSPPTGALGDLQWDTVDPPLDVDISVVVKHASRGQRHRIRRWAEFIGIVFGPTTDELVFDVRHPPGSDVAFVIDADAATIDPSLAKDPTGPQDEVSLGLVVAACVPGLLLWRAGVPSDTPVGAVMHGLLVTWTQYRVFVNGGSVSNSDLSLASLTSTSSLWAIGETTGASLAGSDESHRRLALWLADEAVASQLRGFVVGLVQEFEGIDDGADLLKGLAQLYRATEDPWRPHGLP